MKQHGLLADDGQAGAEARQAHPPNVEAVDEYAAVGDVDQSEEGYEERGFPGACLSDDTHLAATLSETSVQG